MPPCPRSRAAVCQSGASVALWGSLWPIRLTEAGWNDVVILEQNIALGGSTVLSAGLMRRLAPSFLATQGVGVYESGIRAIIKKGYDIGLHRSGSLVLPEFRTRFHRSSAVNILPQKRLDSKAR
ncbi:hypothetical protein BV898_11450 [Hypsibius exemplaris]|uniref:FAD dependent oxidoreductase domain-containing protein n=1 Tax=Hypsibius exemplaris TaxID=2072580 RepID=A0A1W0WGK6_HYPEX|nr:hypothetical protein BV898_11450 [Hypsibius exemplaris]